MGQPKFARKKYETPNHPWQGERIKSEHELRRKFGLKNKTEIWKAQSRLRSIRGQARELISRTRNPDDVQAQEEAKLLIKRLHREGYVGDDAGLNEILGLDVERILNRRLQSQVYLKGMARTPQQARQFVSHGLIVIGQRRVTVPSYVVRRDEEDNIEFVPNASVADPEHPVRPKAPGAEVVAADLAPAQTVTEKPTAGDAPVKEAAAPTVAPSEGHRAESAQREAGPGEAPPAAEAKTVKAVQEAAEVKAPKETKAEAKADKPKAEVKEAPKDQAEAKADKPKAEVKEAPKDQAEAKADKPKETKAEAKADKPKAEVKEAPKAEAKAEKPKPAAKETKADEVKEAPKATADEVTQAPKETKAKAEPKEAKADEVKAPKEAKAKADEVKAKPEAAKETKSAKPDPTPTDEPKEARATKPKEVDEDPATEPKSKTGSADAKEGEE